MDEVANQPHNLPLLVTAETCSGGTYIVTGANTGLGLEATKHLVALGAAKVIMGVRNVSAGETARAEIEAVTGTTGVAEVWALDLASYDSVNVFAKRALAELDRIDALLENAGVAISQRTMAEGHLVSVTVNVFSTFLLAMLLLSKMSESARRFGIIPHIAVVSSGSAFDSKASWDKIKHDPFVRLDEDDEMVFQSYPLSKLIELMAVRHLANLLPVSRTAVVVNAVSPGFCKTSLSRNAPTDFRENMAKMHEKFGRTAEDGSRALLHAIVAGGESHGRYLCSCEIADGKVPGWVTDEDGQQLQKRVWDDIAKELESIEPGCVTKILSA